MNLSYITIISKSTEKMSNKLKAGKLIREQRKKLSLSLGKLSSMSGVSLSHLARIERGERSPSIQALQKIAEPLGFDLNELLIMTGHLSPGLSLYSEEQKEKLRIELNTLLERTISDNKRIKEILDRLLLTQ